MNNLLNLIKFVILFISVIFFSAIIFTFSFCVVIFEFCEKKLGLHE